MQETPSVLVLEREHLARLRQEEQLTGIDLELRSAATLIEAGMRREDSGQVLAFSLRLLSLSGEPPRTDRFAVPVGDLNAARLELARHCGELLNIAAGPRAEVDHDLAHEAEIFALRSNWMSGNDRLEEALVLAEAALGLHPVRQRYHQVFRAHHRIWDRDLKTLENNVKFLRDPTEKRQRQLELLGIRESFVNTITPGNVPLPDDLRPPEPTTGPWARYQRRPLPLDMPPDVKFGELLHVIVDREAKQGNPSLLCFWPVEDRKVFIGRTGLTGGKVTEVGRIPYHSRQLIATTGGGMVFVNSGEAGLAVVASQTPHTYGPAEGFPGKRVVDLEWLEDVLYVNFGNGLARFDPQLERFEILGSNLALEGKGPFEAGGAYGVADMLPDPERGHLWCTAFGSDAQRGVWKYSPQRNTWQRVAGIRTNLYLSRLWWAGDKIHFVADFAWYELDPARGLVTEIAGYRPFERSNMTRFSLGYLQSGDDIIAAEGEMYTRDGQRSRYPQRFTWRMVGAVQQGFLVIDVNDGPTLFQRRASP